MIVANEEATEISQPGQGAFDFPAFAVAAKFPAVIEGRFLAALSMGTDQNNPAPQQAPAQRVAVVALVSDDTQRPRFGAAAAGSRHGYFAQRAFGQRHFSRAGRLQLDSQRNTLAVDHHHPLCALAFLGFSDASAPFLAGAKLPSRNDSLQSRRPFWSSSERNCRHILSHVPSSSHRRKRRQHVLGLGYLAGKSFQRAPVRSIQRIPSSTSRLSAQGRPLLERLGRSGSMWDHCFSERNTSRIRSFSHISPRLAPPKSKNLSPGTYETASNALGEYSAG